MIALSSPAPRVRVARVVIAPTLARAEAPVRARSETPRGGLVVTIGASRIEVMSDFDPSLLRAVVDALGGSTR